LAWAPPKLQRADRLEKRCDPSRARKLEERPMEVLELEIVATAALLVSHLTIVVWNRVTRHSRR